MKIEALRYLRCPLTHNQLQLVSITPKTENALPQDEIEEGYLYTDDGMYYPITGGIPRMLPESMLNFETRFHEWIPDFQPLLETAMEKFGGIVEESTARNRKIQETFGFEWSLLNHGKDIKIWNRSPDLYKVQLEKELDHLPGQKYGLVLDAGCGHGRSAMLMADFSEVVFGVEVSTAVELGYLENQHTNCHFIQADVHHLPFEKGSFDVIYSSGVLHHNPATHAALKMVNAFLKSGGLICIWLYHPFKNPVHWLMRNYRYITRNLHVKLVYALNCISLTPLQWIASQMGKQKKKWTEISIEQLDMLTPKYRHEHTAAEVSNWLEQDHFTEIKVTDSDNYGFSITGNKS
ncbi:MAG: methyltransferase domain-containing protein [Bacteroidota bacterium]